MKYVLIIFFFMILLSCVSKKKSISLKENDKYHSCEERYPNETYNKDSVLNIFANYLNDYIGSYSGKGYYCKDGNCKGFDVLDLADTSNNSTHKIFCLLKNHIYVFSPASVRYGYNNIAILKDNKIKFFKAVNCSTRGVDISLVENYIKDSMPDIANKNEILKRVNSCVSAGEESIMRKLDIDYHAVMYEIFECSD